jgi:hypothetical protein
MYILCLCFVRCESNLSTACVSIRCGMYTGIVLCYLSVDGLQCLVGLVSLLSRYVPHPMPSRQAGVLAECPHAKSVEGIVEWPLGLTPLYLLHLDIWIACSAMPSSLSDLDSETHSLLPPSAPRRILTARSMNMTSSCNSLLQLAHPHPSLAALRPTSRSTAHSASSCAALQDLKIASLLRFLGTSLCTVPTRREQYQHCAQRFAGAQ